MLVFGAPRKCDPFGRLCEKCESMPLLCVVPLSYIRLKNKWHWDLFLEFIALSCSSEVLFVKFPRFLAFLVGFFFGYTDFHAGPCCLPRKYRLAVDLITCT